MRLPAEEEHSAYRFHKDLFLSGMEKIVLVSDLSFPLDTLPALPAPCILVFTKCPRQTARKASTTYYPTLHLELSRYVAFAVEAKYELPWSLQRFVGLPPASVLRIAPFATPTLLPFASGNSSRNSSPGRDRDRVHVRTSTSGGPPVLGLPSPRKLEF
jgi:hypothetical protein